MTIVLAISAYLHRRAEAIDPHAGGGTKQPRERGSERVGRFAEAVEHYRAALRSLPDQAVIHVNLGNVLRAVGRFGEAAVRAYQAGGRSLAAAHIWMHIWGLAISTSCSSGEQFDGRGRRHGQRAITRLMRVQSGRLGRCLQIAGPLLARPREARPFHCVEANLTRANAFLGSLA